MIVDESSLPKAEQAFRAAGVTEAELGTYQSPPAFQNDHSVCLRKLRCPSRSWGRRIASYHNPASPSADRSLQLTGSAIIQATPVAVEPLEIP